MPVFKNLTGSVDCNNVGTTASMDLISKLLMESPKWCPTTATKAISNPK